jgi:hypothetical protein
MGIKASDIIHFISFMITRMEEIAEGEGVRQRTSPQRLRDTKATLIFAG